MSENNYEGTSTSIVYTSTNLAMNSMMRTDVTYLANPNISTSPPPEPEPFIHERNTTPWTPPIVDRTKNKRHLDADEEEI